MAYERLTETVLRRAGADWLAGMSWRALGFKYKSHPKAIKANLGPLGFLNPENERFCTCCKTYKKLPEFNRLGAMAKMALMHNCNQCAANKMAMFKPEIPPQPLPDDEIERLRRESVAMARAHLSKVRAKFRAREASKRAIGKEV